MSHALTDAVATAAAVRSGAVPAVEVTRAALDRIAEADEDVNAFTVVLADSALAAAADVDADRTAGRPLGPLAGVPVAIKDHLWLRAAPATNGSRALAEFVPDADCRAVARLQAAGAIVVGKSNNPEFCYRGITDNDVFGLTRNPRDLTRTPGGSSGGSGAAIAAGMVPLALGTDGGGSIRIPSAFCGTPGLKPTWELVPSLPGFRGWPSVSVVGPMAASVRDLVLAMTVLAPPFQRWDAHGWDGLRVAARVDLGFAELDPDVRCAVEAAVDAVRAAGVPVADAVPDPVDPIPLWDAVALPEGWASEGPLLAAHPELIGADAAQIIRAGADGTLADFLDAQHARRAFTERWDTFFDRYDILLAAAMPVTAFPVGRLAPETIDGRPVPAGFDGWAALALPANLAGLPAACVPAGTGRHGLPVGLQVIGRRGADADVLHVAGLIEALLR